LGTILGIVPVAFSTYLQNAWALLHNYSGGLYCLKLSARKIQISKQKHCRMIQKTKLKN
jgi:hypothetical protein